MIIKCEAPWCDREIKQGRLDKVVGHLLCRSCYQYVWEQSKKLGKPMEEIFPQLPGPNRTVADQVRCARNGCKVEFAEGYRGKLRRYIGKQSVCQSCYEAAWELRKKLNLDSVLEAFKRLTPKGQPCRVEIPSVKCVSPWCDATVKMQEDNKVVDHVFACDKCRSYFRALSRKRTKTPRTWQEFGLDALYARIQPPGEPQKCAMPWCSRVEMPRGYGPDGEPVCNTDSVYLYMYSKRKGITFHKAFDTAPQPRSKKPRK